jgi:hypothetical protein
MGNVILATIYVCAAMILGQGAQTTDKGPQKNAVRTMEKELGRKRVRDILVEVVGEATDLYQFTDDTLVLLKSAGIEHPDRMVNVPRKEYRGKDSFVAAMKDYLGSEDTEKVKAALLASARISVTVEDSFYTNVQERLLKTTVPSEGGRAEEVLRAGIKIFAERYVTYLMGLNSRDKSLVIGTEHLKEFLASQNCGEIPCPRPPCCGNCDPCPKDK